MATYSDSMPFQLVPMRVLQNKLFNCLAASLGLGTQNFQISIPAAPIPASNTGLWSYLNVIPPRSLTFNRSQPADAFFTQYAAVVTQLQYTPTLETVIGAQAYADWSAYLATLHPLPPVCEQAPIFQTWANDNGYANIAMQGASNLSGQCIFEGQQRAVLPYQGPHARPVDFSGTYATLAETVQNASGAGLLFDSDRCSGDVSGTWAAGAQLDLMGLWTGSDPLESISQTFASSRIAIAGQLSHVLAWTATPGGWYSSGLLNLAYSTSASPPWPQDADPSWEDAFGPGGSMLYFIASVLVGDGLNLQLTSGATFCASDQQIISAHAGQGLWPFYTPTGPAVTTTVAFDGDGHLTITTICKQGHPFILGAVVLPVAQYLGRAGA
ncbi:MAG TPA: hypothetical protein VFS21_25225 [Roseiflexaceae bacterium]|nr:hypothetical protein [Roseiflexaceae bacterium]